jgi:hypothetical protein
MYRNFKVAEKVGTPFRVYHLLILNHGDRLKPYLLYAFYATSTHEFPSFSIFIPEG